jgi:hypothetical protein
MGLPNYSRAVNAPDVAGVNLLSQTGHAKFLGSLPRLWTFISKTPQHGPFSQRMRTVTISESRKANNVLLTASQQRPVFRNVLNLAFLYQTGTKRQNAMRNHRVDFRPQDVVHKNSLL